MYNRSLYAILWNICFADNYCDYRCNPTTEITFLLFFDRRCVENAFGILVSRWRIYERQINMEPRNADIIVKATCVLHNFQMLHLRTVLLATRISKTCLELWAVAPGDKDQKALQCSVWRNQRPITVLEWPMRCDRSSWSTSMMKAKCLGNGSCQESSRNVMMQTNKQRVANQSQFTIRQRHQYKQPFSGLPTWCFGSEAPKLRYPPP